MTETKPRYRIFWRRILWKSLETPNSTRLFVVCAPVKSGICAAGMIRNSLRINENYIKKLNSSYKDVAIQIYQYEQPY